MSRADSYTDERGEDPTPCVYDVRSVADPLLRVWETRPDEHAGKLSRETYVELVLRIAHIDRERPNWKKQEWPRVEDIYEDLENSEVQQVGMSNLEGSHVLKVAPAQSKKTANGWTSTRTSYEIAPGLRQKLFSALELGTPAELAEAVEGAATEALRKRVDDVEMGVKKDLKTRSYSDSRRESLNELVGFFSPSPQAAAGPNHPEEDGREEKDGNEAGLEGEEPRGAPDEDADVASNGCYTGSSETASNRRSERSDREKRGGSKLSKPPSRDGSTDRDLGSFYQPNRGEFEARGTRKQRRFLDERVQMPAERLLFLHLLGESKQASYSAAGEDEWTTVPAETLEQEMGAPYHSTYRVWRDSDLVGAYDDGFYVPPNDDDIHPRARKFRIPDSVMERWNALAGGSKRYWLHTAEPERTAAAQPLSTSLSDENNNGLPELVDRALRVLQDADHRIRTAPIEDAISQLSVREGQEAIAQKVGLQFVLETIKRQTTASEDGVSRLKNAYEMTFGGRILFKNGGPQGLMGAVKARAYDIEGLRNYDIKSCHTSALRQVADKLKKVGVDVDLSAWEEYPGKDTVVDQTGLPRTLVKVTEHAIKYGAYLPSSIAQAEAVFADTSIDVDQLQLVKAAKKYAEDPDEALGKLYEVFSDMRQVIKQIADALLSEYYDATNKGGYMHNACGVSFNPRNYDEGHERQTKVMAWMLQGLEAAFIHSLTILSAEKDDFDVVANEHDGLIVKGEIPEEAIEATRIMSGFHRAELVEKPHADEEEIAEVYGENEDELEEDNASAEQKSRAEPETGSTDPGRKIRKQTAPKSSPGRVGDSTPQRRQTPMLAPQTREEGGLDP